MKVSRAERELEARPSEVRGGGPRRHWPEDSSGEGERRLTGGVVGRVRAVDATATGIAAAERAEVEPCLGAGVTDRLEAATATRTRDRSRATITNRQDEANAGIGRVEHLGSRLSGW